MEINIDNNNDNINNDDANNDDNDNDINVDHDNNDDQYNMNAPGGSLDLPATLIAQSLASGVPRRSLPRRGGPRS